MMWPTKKKLNDIEIHLRKRFAIIPTMVEYAENSYWVWLEKYISFAIAYPPEGDTEIFRYKTWEDAKSSCKRHLDNGDYVL